MKPFLKHKGSVAPFPKVNIDTDQILPKEFLKRIERTGYGRFLFYNWRYLQYGTDNPDFILNKPEYQDVSILVAGPNFGCGSSREHAPWALKDFGFQVVIASSFADIFQNNCIKNGILPITMDKDKINILVDRASNLSPYQLEVDLEENTIRDQHGLEEKFIIDAYQREILIKGLDDIGITGLYANEINRFEMNRKSSKFVYVQSK